MVSLAASMQADTSAALASLLSVARSISDLLIIQFLLGLLMGFPSSHIPTLQDEVFGDKAFAIVGAFGGVKGILSLVTAPSIGYFADAVGRREALTVALFLSLLPSIWVAVFDLFWGYYVTDALVGVYSGVMSIVMACVADQLQVFEEDERLGSNNSSPSIANARNELDINNIDNGNNNQPHESTSPSSNTNNNQNQSSSASAEELVKRTRAMSIAMAAMGVGMIFGAGFGTLLTYQNAFRCSMVAGIVSVCLVHWPMRTYLDRLTVISQADKGSSNGVPPPPVSVATSNNHNQTPDSSSSTSRNPNPVFGQPTAANSDENEEEDDDDADDEPVHSSHHHPQNSKSNKKREKSSLLSPQNKNEDDSKNDNNNNNQFVQQSQHAFNSIGTSMARSQRTLKTFTGLRHLAGIVFCDSLVLQAMAILIPLFLKKHLHFVPADQTVMMISLGISSAIGLLVIVPFLTAKLKTMGMLRLALLADMIMVSLYSFVRSKFLAQILPLFTCVGVAMFPCASSLASEVMFGSANTSEGLAQGIVSAARMFAEGVSPLVLGGLLSFFEETKFPGMPFLVVGVQELIALFLTIKLENFMNLPSAWRFEEVQQQQH